MTMKDVSGMKARQAVEDAERLIRMVAQQAKTSLPKAGSIIAKLCAVYAFGLVLASKCCLSSLLVPISVVTLAIAAGWLDAIGQECKHHLYFPYKTLNSVGALLFRWEWTVFWACILFALNLSRAAIIDRVWSLSTMAVAPLALMFLGRALEPYRFHRARRDVSNAEALVRKLLSAQKVSDSVAMAPLIESEKTSLYNLGSFAKLLHGFVAGHKAAQKLSTELSQPCGTVHKGLFKRLLSSIYSPFRTAASEMFLWESWDIVLHIVVALYLGLVYTGSYYFREPMSYWVACCVLVPFVGPKSKAGRYVRALQENIRFAQGSALEKKDKMTVTGDQQSVAKVVNWPMLVYIASVHLTVLYTLVVLIFFGGICPHFDQQGAAVRWETIVLAGALCLCSALGITGGVQRLWSHKSYKAGFPLKVILMVFNSIANQGSIFHWARDHRVHHLYSDTIADPHDANRGFFPPVGQSMSRLPALMLLGLCCGVRCAEGVTAAEVAKLWKQTRGENCSIAVAVALAESGGNCLENSGNPGSVDRGLWMINSYRHSEVTDACAYDCNCNAQSANIISSGGRNWQTWATYNSSAYKSYLLTAQEACGSDKPPAFESPEDGGYCMPNSPSNACGPCHLAEGNCGYWGSNPPYYCEVKRHTNCSALVAAETTTVGKGGTVREATGGAALELTPASAIDNLAWLPLVSAMFIGVVGAWKLVTRYRLWRTKRRSH